MPKFDDHPLSELTVRGGKLIRRISDAYEPEYLVTEPIHIVAKKDLTEMGPTDVLYRFDLNDRPDQTWIEIFIKCRGDNEALITDAQLQLRCIPANLDGRYQRAKEAIAETNRLYAEHKSGLINKVTQLDAERQQQAGAQAARSAVVNNQFKDLPL